MKSPMNNEPVSLYEKLDDALARNADNADINGIIRGPLAEIALGRSEHLAVMHPLGFSSLYLETQGNRSVCVHDWPNEPPDSAQNEVGETHQHSWKLKCRILRGLIVNTLVEVNIGSYLRGATHAIFDARSRGVVDELVEVDKVAVILDRESANHEEGETYTVVKGDFHESQWIGDAVTLVLADNDPTATNMMLGRLDGALPPVPWKTYQIPRIRYTPEGTARLATRVMHLLGLEPPETPEVRGLLEKMPGAHLL